MKGPLAALLDAFFSARVDEGRLTLAIIPSEETTQSGGASLGQTLWADGYIVGEPTGLDACHAARGQFSRTGRDRSHTPIVSASDCRLSTPQRTQ